MNKFNGIPDIIKDRREMKPSQLVESTVLNTESRLLWIHLWTPCISLSNGLNMKSATFSNQINFICRKKKTNTTTG